MLESIQKEIIKELDLYIENFKNWWEEESDNINFHCILINYDLRSKDLIESNNFYVVEPKNTNKIISSRLIYHTLVNVCGKIYYVRRYYKSTHWFFENTNEVMNKLIINYLKKYNFEKSFFIKSLSQFLRIFLDYPKKYETNGIILLPINKKLLIYIDDHGSVILASDSKLTIDNLRCKLSKLNFTILQR